MIRIVIPGIPPTFNRYHWSYGKKKKEWLKKVRFQLKERKLKLDKPIKKSVIFYRFFFPDKNRRDATNLYGSVKILEDGLVNEGIISDDSIKHTVPVAIPNGIDPKNPRVIIEIEEALHLDYRSRNWRKRFIQFFQSH